MTLRDVEAYFSVPFRVMSQRAPDRERCRCPSGICSRVQIPPPHQISISNRGQAIPFSSIALAHLRASRSIYSINSCVLWNSHFTPSPLSFEVQFGVCSLPEFLDRRIVIYLCSLVIIHLRYSSHKYFKVFFCHFRKIFFNPPSDVLKVISSITRL